MDGLLMTLDRTERTGTERWSFLIFYQSAMASGPTRRGS